MVIFSDSFPEIDLQDVKTSVQQILGEVFSKIMNFVLLDISEAYEGICVEFQLKFLINKCLSISIFEPSS